MKKQEYDMGYHNKRFRALLENKRLYELKGKVAKKEYFVGFNEESRVLEFGTGIGQNLRFIKNKYGYDINRELYPILKENGINTFDSIDKIPDNFFDEILVCQVLEHLENPIKILKLLRKKLKKDGKIRIVVPKAYYSLPNNMNTTKNGHLYCWSFLEMNYLLNLCGFKNVLNKKIYRRGADKLMPLAKINFSLYFALIKTFGFLMRNFDLLVIAEKD